jgi:hypothetical protein
MIIGMIKAHPTEKSDALVGDGTPARHGADPVLQQNPLLSTASGCASVSSWP